MRSVSSTLRAALYALTTDEGLLAFIKISHPTAFATLFFCSDSIVRTIPPGVDQYEPGLPGWTFPPDAEDEEGIVTLSIEAISVKGRELVAAVRTLQDEKGEVVLDFRRLKDTTVSEGSVTLNIATAKYNDQRVVLELSLDSFLDEAYGDSYTPDLFPALFQGAQ